MSLLSLNFASIKYSKVPALRNGLKAYEDDRLNDALEIIHASQGDLAQELPDKRDLFALLQESQSFVDALADAIETFQDFPHLASGYNRASEIYMQMGQGLHATEVYEAGLKAIGEDGDPQQRTLLQNHRHEMELQYRDFIALLPVEITERIFQEFSDDFCLRTCTAVSTTWFPKAVYNISSVTIDYPVGPGPVVVSRLWEYIDTLQISTDDTGYLVEFFGGLRKEPFGGKWKRLNIRQDYVQKDLVDLHKIMAPGLTRISQSLGTLDVESYELISPVDLLAVCPNLTSFKYGCISSLPSVQKTIPQRDKLTQLLLGIHRPYPESFVSDLQSIIRATPNVRVVHFPPVISDVLRIVPQHWRKLRRFYMGVHLCELFDKSLEGEGVLDIYDEGSNLANLYEYICLERMRLSRLIVGTNVTMSAEITPVQFPVLKYLSIKFYGMDEYLQSIVLELIRGAAEVLEELVLKVTVLPPVTYEVLARMPRLERLTLSLAFFAGIDVYLEHLASLGTSSPLKSVTIHDWSFDDSHRTILATRIPTLKEIIILTSLVREDHVDTWILPLLKGLVRSKSKVERISIPEYAMTTRVIHTLSNLSELRELDVVKYYIGGEEYSPLWRNEHELESTIPRINVEVRHDSDVSYDTYFYLEELGIL